MIKEEPYTISISIDNDEKEDLLEKDINFHALSYYKSDIEIIDKIYSRVFFAMHSDYSIMRASSKTRFPTKYPKLIINISNVSIIDPNMPIMFTLPKKSNLEFHDELDDISIVNGEFGEIELDKKNKLKVTINNIIDLNQPIEIENIQIINNNSSFLSFKDESSPEEHLMEVSYDEHSFTSPTKIYIGTPQIEVEEQIIFWPFDELKTSAIDIICSIVL